MPLPPLPFSGTARVVLRQLTARDVRELLAAVLGSRTELGRFMNWPREMTSLEQARTFVQLGRDGWLGERTARFGMFERETGVLLGTIELDNVHRRRGQAELGYWVRSDYAGRGYATEAGAALLVYGFQSLGLHKIKADVAVGNEGSARVLDKLGFTRDGTLREDRAVGGTWLDHWSYSILDREFAERYSLPVGRPAQHR